MYELYYFRDVSSELRPESIGTHELVWEQYFGEWLRTSVSGYRYSASRLITLEDDGLDSAGLSTVAFFNGGVATARGLEFEGEVRSRGGLELLGSYARQRAEDGEHARMPNSPGHMAKLRLSAPGPFDRSVAALEVQYLAARQTYLGTTVAGAAFAQATFSTRVTGSVDVVASIRNLFDTVYSDPASEEHAFHSIPQNGRTARIGLRWKLWTPWLGHSESDASGPRSRGTDEGSRTDAHLFTALTFR